MNTEEISWLEITKMAFGIPLILFGYGAAMVYLFGFLISILPLP